MLLRKIARNPFAYFGILIFSYKNLRKTLKSFIVLFALFIACNLSAQVVGGDIYYIYKGLNKYEIVLNVFYTCNQQSPDAYQDVIIFENIGHRIVPPLKLALDSSKKEARVQSGSCSVEKDCIVKATYKKEIELMQVTGGYNITWDFCCWKRMISNLDPLKIQGINLSAIIPGPEIQANNSMPVFNALPQLIYCKKQLVTFSARATDADGDSLAYELDIPFSKESNDKPGQLARTRSDGPIEANLPQPPPYPKIRLTAGFTEKDPAGKDAVKLDSRQGSFEMIMPAAGTYLLSYSVKEFRRNKLLSKHQRVFLVTVIP